MKKMSEEQAGGYIGSLIDRNSALKKAVNRHFQGIIVHVDAPDGNWPFTVNIDRTEGPDGNDWICAIPGYVPKIGDEVECEWRDEDTGYIKYPLKYNKFIASVAQQTGQSITVGGVVVVYDTLVNDPYKCFDSLISLFTCPYSGVYRVSAAFRVPASSELVLNGLQNGTLTRRLALTGATSAFFTTGTSDFFCKAGDTLSILAALPPGAQTTSEGIVANWFDVEYLGPL